ncbi:hypothetical protein [Geochorda subterranea]|uniref:Uncharacterized protein n=1 Tax=Geochorda subterranea TaxID=3109564 RepID=A0ABZ1BLQ5_9FIRM|nr:hypothetical protein [Limnochorda sp. LNt]WRP13518.1 hypothetical protein VLY81_08640 [Limnochorda sp. LNt]
MDELLPLLIWAAIVVLGAIRNASRQRARTGRSPAARSPQPRPARLRRCGPGSRLRRPR